MKTFMSAVTRSLTGIAIAAIAMGAAFADTTLPEVSKDGLHLLQGTKVKVAYVRPGTTFSKYKKVKILDCFVAFAKDWQKDYNMDQIGLDGMVTDRFAEEMKKRLAAEFKTVFTNQLSQAGYPVVDEAGPDVLLLRPALLNVYVTAPDVMTANMSMNFIRSAGGMTLYMEVYDAGTNTLLARVADPQADPENFGRPASSVTNKMAADEILRRWAGLLVGALREVNPPSVD